ncbi:hypothetical protein S14_93 [Shewanella sp. phage 1/4]|uniref:hypothetical protein n=1 Tax=Shewanella phage 1/4 TaxID=1458859 RepID=UPI0004F892CF|nr:hypothetical protein S14_93 [Shewanella sp. phage 1/4]AHK11202.1 hypothetical protein S14_93 [Shewanella sp. phage 1/4]
MTTKIIFLDIDGVLNNGIDSDTHYDASYGEYFLYSLKCVARLNRLISATGASIVVSSTWRLGLTLKEIRVLLNNMGIFAPVVGVTDDLSRYPCCRGNEIYKWIEDNEELLKYDYYYNYKSYIILDDDTDMLLWQKNNFVNTDGQVGLTAEDVKKAIEILNKEK